MLNRKPKTIWIIILAALWCSAFGQPHWTWRNPTPTGNSLNGVTFGQKFVTVGSLGTIMSSTNGKDWSLETSGTLSDLNGITWTGSEYVAVGFNGTVLLSKNASVWTTQIAEPFKYFYAVSRSPAMLAIVGENGAIYTSPYSAASAAPYTWTSRTAGTTNGLYGLTYGDSISADQPGQFIAVGYQGTIIRSINGVDWTTSVSGTNSYLQSVVWNGKRFLAAGENGTIVSSVSGKDWTTIPSGIPYTIQKVVWLDSQFIAFIPSSDSIFISKDGAVWTPKAAKQWGLSDAVYSAGEFVAVGAGGILCTSVDADTWTLQTKGFQDYLTGVAWSGSTYVAIGQSNTVETSSDCSTWTTRTIPKYCNLNNITWTGKQFVAVGRFGDIITSPDGVDWTLVNSGTIKELYAVLWTGTQCVAVGISGVIITSPDGTNWTTQTAVTTNDLNSVIWTGKQFVAVGDNSTAATSMDGKTWSVARIELPTRDLMEVVWTGSLYVAVGGWVGCIYTSPDAIAWTSKTFPVTGNLVGVVWTGKQLVSWSEYGDVITSTNGIDWAVSNEKLPMSMKDIILGPNHLVAVGYNSSVLTAPMEIISAVKDPQTPKTQTRVLSTRVAVTGELVRLTLPFFSEGKIASWALFSCAGKQLCGSAQTVMHNQLEIPIAKYPSGTYLVRTKCNGVSREFRLIKN